MATAGHLTGVLLLLLLLLTCVASPCCCSTRITHFRCGVVL